MANPPEPSPLTLAPHRLSMVLLQPQIAPNAGNVARLCVATGTALHLVRPLGFTLDDRTLRRSAMDYWPRLRLTMHESESAYLALAGTSQGWLFSSRGERCLWDVPFADGDQLVFGNEPRGASAAAAAHFVGRTVRIPQIEGERCLNLSTAVGIGLMEALRVLHASTAQPSGAHD